MLDFVTSLAIESWTLYTIGMILVLLRLWARYLKLRTWRLQLDDWLMVFAAANFTGCIVSVNIVAVNGSSYMDPAVAAALTPEEHADAVLGSKFTLILEMFELTCEWTVKACLLFIYYRLTNGLPKWQKFVWFICGYCVLGYSLTVGLLLGYWCHPIYEYWAVPYNISQCATYYSHMIFATGWNISSDLMLLAVPFPIIFKTQLPLKRKIILCCVLCLGVLNIIIAVLNRYYNFSNPNDLGYVYFYVAEVATAMYVGNVPLTWPLIQRVLKSSSWGSRDTPNSKQFGKSGPTLHTIGGTGATRSARHKLTSTTRSTRHSPWGKLDDVDLEEGSSGHSPSRDDVSGRDDTSIMELTPRWHREANTSDVHAVPQAREPSHGPSTETKSPFSDDGKTVIMKTVEISHSSHAR